MYKVSSYWLSSIFFGDKIWDVITPWSLRINLEEQHVIVSKRNYYLIGVDRKVIPFRNIRYIDLDEHLFGADLLFKVYGGPALKARCLPKRGARRLYQLGLEEITRSKRGTKFN